MKKILTVSLAVLLAFGLLGRAVAVSENSANAPGQNKDSVKASDGEDGDTGETEKKVKEAKPDYNPRSQTAREHMSDVAKAVEELVRMSDRTEDPGIGDQVREIAKAQGESEDKANEAIDNAEGRGAALKFFLGADYKELKKVKKEMQENENRVRELNGLMDQIENESDKQGLSEQIRVLEEKNKEFSDYLEEKTAGFSLLGWLFKWINKY